jgi:hypothetical protein
VKIIENDWKEYFSLEDLTNAKCRASVHHCRTPEKNLVMGKNGGFKLETVDMLAVSIMMKTIKIKTLLEVLLRDASG